MAQPDTITRIAEGFDLDQRQADDLRGFAKKLGRKFKVPKTRDPFMSPKDL